MRQGLPVLAGGRAEVLETGSPHVFAYQRRNDGGCFTAVANFSEAPQAVGAAGLGLPESGAATDLVSGAEVVWQDTLTLEGCQLLWLWR